MDFAGLSEAELKEHPLAFLIKEYERESTTLNGVTQERVKLKLYDAQRALFKLVDVLGLNAPAKIAPVEPDGKTPYKGVVMVEVIRPPKEES